MIHPSPLLHLVGLLGCPAARRSQPGLCFTPRARYWYGSEMSGELIELPRAVNVTSTTQKRKEMGGSYSDVSDPHKKRTCSDVPQVKTRLESCKSMFTSSLQDISQPQVSTDGTPFPAFLIDKMGNKKTTTTTTGPGVLDFSQGWATPWLIVAIERAKSNQGESHRVAPSPREMRSYLVEITPFLGMTSSSQAILHLTEKQERDKNPNQGSRIEIEIVCRAAVLIGVVSFVLVVSDLVVHLTGRIQACEYRTVDQSSGNAGIQYPPRPLLFGGPERTLDGAGFFLRMYRTPRRWPASQFQKQFAACIRRTLEANQVDVFEGVPDFDQFNCNFNAVRQSAPGYTGAQERGALHNGATTMLTRCFNTCCSGLGNAVLSKLGICSSARLKGGKSWAHRNLVVDGESSIELWLDEQVNNANHRSPSPRSPGINDFWVCSDAIGRGLALSRSASHPGAPEKLCLQKRGNRTCFEVCHGPMRGMSRRHAQIGNIGGNGDREHNQSFRGHNSEVGARNRLSATVGTWMAILWYPCKRRGESVCDFHSQGRAGDRTLTSARARRGNGGSHKVAMAADARVGSSLATSISEVPADSMPSWHQGVSALSGSTGCREEGSQAAPCRRRAGPSSSLRPNDAASHRPAPRTLAPLGSQKPVLAGNGRFILALLTGPEPK
ncbi:hypothetical protein QBC37DRAFT_395562 [Rhypophila decipiens]|uniref:Uncharacterized protein n=1 Tax=Rhypophila decipiens TaxID=261697 RepID=A0AAN7BCC0_9PEZI|nr:hypothetical protein QBC37DRAFT_395562 [Rhypophila decipiens]